MENNINTEFHIIEPYVLIDELSSSEIYIGTSDTFNDKVKPTWKIKRIIKIGSVWQMGYPDGKQDYKFIWDNRLSYDYK